MTRILVIDDEPDTVRFVQRALIAEGYQVLTSTNGADGLRIALSEQPDLVLLDLVMPGLEGKVVLSALTAQDPSMRIMVLSATTDVQLRIACLEQGAVDFLSKPFVVRELLARIHARLWTTGASGKREESLQVGDIVLDLKARQLHFDNRLMPLSQREFLLLLHLMRNANAVCSRQELLSEVWGYDFDPATNVLDVCVGRLRGKLQKKNIIQTVRNVGYQFQTV
jgi:DNA-binding response OmpR family regulator